MADEPIDNSASKNYYNPPTNCPTCGNAAFVIRLPKLAELEERINSYTSSEFSKIKENIYKNKFEIISEALKKHKFVVLFSSYYTCVFLILGMYLWCLR